MPDAVFKAVADPTRRAILDRLAVQDECVQDLARDFDMSLPAVSQHLRVLHGADLVTWNRAGRRIIYHLNASPLREVSRWISPYERFWKARLDALGAHLRKKHG